MTPQPAGVEGEPAGQEPHLGGDGVDALPLVQAQHRLVVVVLWRYQFWRVVCEVNRGGRDFVSVLHYTHLSTQTKAIATHQPELAPGRGHDRAAVLLDECVRGHAHRVGGGQAFCGVVGRGGMEEVGVGVLG